MLRSRMFTPGFRLAFGIAALYLVMAFSFAVSSTLQSGDGTVKDMLFAVGVINLIVGPLTLGWKGGVGNHLGYVVFLTAAVASALVAFVLVAFRDADPEAEAQLLQVESVPLTRAPNGGSFAPVMGAVSLLVLAVGWVSNPWVVYAGFGLLLLTAVTWTIRAWAERATGDDEVNYAIYKQIIDPFRVPIVGALAIAFVVLAFSRVLLTVPDENWSRLLFLGVGALFFVAVVGVALAPKVGKGFTVLLLVIAGLLLLGGLIYGAVNGARPVGEGEHTEQTGTEGGSTTGDTHEGGLAPVPASPVGAAR